MVKNCFHNALICVLNNISKSAIVFNNNYLQKKYVDYLLVKYKFNFKTIALLGYANYKIDKVQKKQIK